MVKFGDLLSNKTAKELLLDHLHVGDVYRMHLGKEEKVKGKKISDDGRNKYFIIIGFDANGDAIGLVLIESHINPYLPESRKLLHYLIKASEYSFLNGEDRYVDCSDLKEITADRFMSLFSGEKAKGRINEEDMKLIKGAIASYEDAKPKLLKKYGLI